MEKFLNKLIKCYLFMPAEKDTTKLILALAFYLLGAPIAAGIVGAILGLTIILSPLSLLIGLVSFAYTVSGVVFAILSYTGKPIEETFASIQSSMSKDAPAETPAEEATEDAVEETAAE